MGGVERVRLLARGGMAEVWLARMGSAPVALKVRMPSRSDLRSRGLFERELELTARVNHPNVVAALGTARCNDEDALVLELLDGVTLNRFLYALRSAGLRLPLRLACHLAHEVIGGLAAVHAAGYVHGDLGPDNIHVEPAGEVKLFDLGIAQPVGTSLGPLLMGKAGRVAPEQIRGGALTPQTDFFALGVLLFDLFGLPAPFDRRDLLKCVRELSTYDGRGLPPLRGMPPRVAELTLQLLQPQPGSRPRSAPELQAALRQALGELGGWRSTSGRKELAAAFARALPRWRPPRTTMAEAAPLELVDLVDSDEEPEFSIEESSAVILLGAEVLEGVELRAP